MITFLRVGLNKIGFPCIFLEYKGFMYYVSLDPLSQELKHRPVKERGKHEGRVGRRRSLINSVHL